MATLSREHVIAAMLVTGVVVIVGFASGLGLRTTTSAAQPGGAGLTQTSPDTGTRLPEAVLPQAVQPPAMSMPATDVVSTPGTDDVPSEPAMPVQTAPGDAGEMPSLPVSQPGSPILPHEPGPPASGTPPTCLPGVPQQVADTVNTIVPALPVVGGLTGTLGLTEAPDQSSPGALNTLLYSVTGFCAATDPAAPAPALAPASPLTAVLPKAGG